MGIAHKENVMIKYVEFSYVKALANGNARKKNKHSLPLCSSVVQKSQNKASVHIIIATDKELFYQN